MSRSIKPCPSTELIESSVLSIACCVRVFNEPIVFLQPTGASAKHQDLNGLCFSQFHSVGWLLNHANHCLDGQVGTASISNVEESRFELRSGRHDHDLKSLNPCRGRGGAALLNVAPAVSASGGHGQRLASWQSSSRSTQECCPPISFTVSPFFFLIERCLGGWSSIGHWLLSCVHTNVIFFSSRWSAALHSVSSVW